MYISPPKRTSQLDRPDVAFQRFGIYIPSRVLTKCDIFSVLLLLNINLFICMCNSRCNLHEMKLFKGTVFVARVII